MAVLRIEKIFASGNQAVYVLRTPAQNQEAVKLLAVLTAGRKQKPEDQNFDGVNFYNAVRGYLDEKGLPYGQQGELPATAVMRLNDSNAIQGLDKLLEEAQNYAAIERRIHSKSDDEKLEEFRGNLINWASRYEQL